VAFLLAGLQPARISIEMIMVDRNHADDFRLYFTLNSSTDRGFSPGRYYRASLFGGFYCRIRVIVFANFEISLGFVAFYHKLIRICLSGATYLERFGISHYRDICPDDDCWHSQGLWCMNKLTKGA
jgi:hypothetical protein